jgi:hypothetical protein
LLSSLPFICARFRLLLTPYVNYSLFASLRKVSK